MRIDQERSQADNDVGQIVLYVDVGDLFVHMLSSLFVNESLTVCCLWSRLCARVQEERHHCGVSYEVVYAIPKVGCLLVIFVMYHLLPVSCAAFLFC